MTMKAVEAQKDFLRLLDAVEQGEEVVVEHGGRRFRLSLVPPATTKTVSSPLIIEDTEVLSGNWTWVSDEEGRLQFRARREKS
jgi:antitoxin (DNA-binding transcriptional repressor) of toxin-antitoxin stability system